VNDKPVPMTPHAPDEWMRRFGTLPLMHQPGERWMYNTGSLLQGVLVARASDRDFPAFVHERILAPLGMRDTGFFVSAEKLERYAGCGLFTDPQTRVASRMDGDGVQSAYSRPPAFPSGAAGLVSTVDDYLLFARMLMNGGRHGGVQLLRAETVREMTTDRLTPEQAAAGMFFPGFFDTWGWGYGVGVVKAPDAVSPVPGRYGCPFGSGARDSAAARRFRRCPRGRARFSELHAIAMRTFHVGASPVSVAERKHASIATEGRDDHFGRAGLATTLDRVTRM
jgi:CubicO group peptidase (beta-lactamase class C family)